MSIKYLRPSHIVWPLLPYDHFSSAWLHQQSSWNRNSIGFRRLSVCGIDYLWTYYMDSFQILILVSPGPHAQIYFWIFDILFYYFFIFIFDECFSFSISISNHVKCYSSNKSQRKVFKLFLIFFPIWSSQNCVWDFFRNLKKFKL